MERITGKPPPGSRNIGITGIPGRGCSPTCRASPRPPAQPATPARRHAGTPSPVLLAMGYDPARAAIRPAAHARPLGTRHETEPTGNRIAATARTLRA